jgi:hypothetical protein
MSCGRARAVLTCTSWGFHRIPSSTLKLASFAEPTFARTTAWRALQPASEELQERPQVLHHRPVHVRRGLLRKPDDQAGRRGVRGRIPEQRQVLGWRQRRLRTASPAVHDRPRGECSSGRVQVLDRPHPLQLRAAAQGLRQFPLRAGGVLQRHPEGDHLQPVAAKPLVAAVDQAQHPVQLD